jgi:adenylate cyclase
MRGFGEAASGRWEEAVPYLERFIKYNPKTTFGYITLANIYAHVGRIQDAQTALEKGIKGWPPTMKSLRSIMTMLPLKDSQMKERFAEGYLKAGLPGEPSGYYKITAENRLTGDEIRERFIGHQVTGLTIATGKPWHIERKEDGSANIQDSDKKDTGKSWVEDDMLCDQWDHFYEGLKDCWVIYRNPEGTAEGKDEYLGAPGYGVYPFSIIE